MNFVKPLLNWYEANRRDLPWRRTRDPYAIWVSEIMLQQTRVAAVIPYYLRFLEELPDVHALSTVDEDRLLKLWQGLGYYSRAKNLKRAAIEIEERYSGQFPDTYRELLKLSGIGPYTAGAIASIAFGERVPAVDGNALRVFLRLWDADWDVSKAETRERVTERLIKDLPKEAGTFNQAVMELGATVCVPNGAPLCDRCPWSELCLAKKNGTIGERPVRSPKKQRIEEAYTVFVLEQGERFLIRKRTETGLLSGLFELPNRSGHLVSMSPDGKPDLTEAVSVLEELGVTPTGAWSVYRRRHVFTHRTWQMQVVRVSVTGEAPEGYLYYDGTQSVPTAFAVCLP